MDSTVVHNSESHLVRIGLRVFYLNLKGQCHEIFDPLFFCQSITPRSQIDTLKYFRILFQIRRDIRL
jgi:hypothetical protein